jgi:ferredoxin
LAVTVNQEACIGCGACTAVCPEGFEMKDGKSQVKDGNATCAEKAISACPVNAISNV